MTPIMLIWVITFGYLFAWALGHYWGWSRRGEEDLEYIRYSFRAGRLYERKELNERAARGLPAPEGKNG